MTRFAFAGDRQLSVNCLRFLIDNGERPEALLVSSPARATHADDLIELAGLEESRVVVGNAFREPVGIELLRSLDLDYVIGVHFPYIVPADVLEIPRIGVVNLHPALLPHNRGWHTPSWAIVEQTPIGATLHFMDSGVDTGDIVVQAELDVRPDDTADSLYRRLLDLEFEVFQEAWPLLASGSPPRLPQESDEGTSHSRADLETIGRLDPEATMPVGDVLRRLRGLSTNNVGEAAYFEEDGRRYRVQVTITPDSQID